MNQNPSKRVIIAGGSGFLGTRLAEELVRRQYDVVILSRTPGASSNRIRTLAWDGRTVGPWAEELEGAAAIVNLAGRTVSCRHTPENRREIIDSRVHSVEALGDALARGKSPPPVWVQASSLAIYGDTGDRWCDEHAPDGAGFSVETCKLWESALTAHATPAVRQVILRIGFALDRGRGALSVLERLVRYGLGGTVGSGRQYISWIHWRDLNSMFISALERSDLAGAFNATAPSPVTNAEFMRELRRALHRPWSPPAPEFAVRIGSWFLRTEPSLALTGRRCTPKNFLERGFTFAFPDLRPALADVYDGAR